MADSSPSAALRSSALAVSRCLSIRPVMKERRTFASTTTRCTSDAPSPFARFVNGFHHVARAVLHITFPSEERRPLGGDGDPSAADLPRELVAGREVERFAHFLRHGRLSLAGHGGCGHAVSPYASIADVRNAAEGSWCAHRGPGGVARSGIKHHCPEHARLAAQQAWFDAGAGAVGSFGGEAFGYNPQPFHNRGNR